MLSTTSLRLGGHKSLLRAQVKISQRLRSEAVKGTKHSKGDVWLRNQIDKLASLQKVARP